jgi:hypothetical protein
LRRARIFSSRAPKAAFARNEPASDFSEKQNPTKACDFNRQNTWRHRIDQVRQTDRALVEKLYSTATGGERGGK